MISKTIKVNVLVKYKKLSNVKINGVFHSEIPLPNDITYNWKIINKSTNDTPNELSGDNRNNSIFLDVGNYELQYSSPHGFQIDYPIQNFYINESDLNPQNLEYALIKTANFKNPLNSPKISVNFYMDIRGNERTPDIVNGNFKINDTIYTNTQTDTFTPMIIELTPGIYRFSALDEYAYDKNSLKPEDEIIIINENDTSKNVYLPYIYSDSIASITVKTNIENGGICDINDPHKGIFSNETKSFGLNKDEQLNIKFLDVKGYKTPDPISINIKYGENKIISGSYEKI